GTPNLAQEVVHTVLAGGQGYCQHESLLRSGETTQTLLQAAQRLVMEHQASIPFRHDVVHFDFQPFNLLTDGQRLSGVVDWDGPRIGDGAFDWATLLFYGYENKIAHSIVWGHALQWASIQVLSTYLAHLFVRQVDWSLRHHHESVAQIYIRRSVAILNDIATRLQ
ncbi:MAG TPA: phosphotransferase, partial [Ktedonobacterales bacterium]|nr:phosphotransferase [Ktedonobacterales bacterium]